VLDDELTCRTRCVIFDFDGPLCKLFGGYPAHEVARVMVGHLGELGLPVPAVDDLDDPHAILRATAAGHRAPGGAGSPAGPAVVELESRLTAEEVRAAASAVPTPHADDLVRTLAADGLTLAVASNNTPLAVERYLRSRGLAELFGRHIHGRRPDPSLMKPDPDSVRRVLQSTGINSAHCLMIGDAVSDHTAARRAGVPFLGFAPDDRRAEALRGAGVEGVLRSMEAVDQKLRHM
jgi:HAD superfamily hydrolase (TIGR01549 family)